MKVVMGRVKVFIAKAVAAMGQAAAHSQVDQKCHATAEFDQQVFGAPAQLADRSV